MNNYKSFFLTIVTLLMVSTIAFSQVLITEETFEDESNLDITGTMSNGEPWDATVFNDCDGHAATHWGVDDSAPGNNLFRCQDVEGFNCGPCQTGSSNLDCGDNQNIIVFGPIDISAFNFASLSIDVDQSGNMECGGNGDFPCPDPPLEDTNLGHDQMIFEYQIDGGAWVIFEYRCGDNFCFGNNASACSLEGNTLFLRVKMGAQATSEAYTIDNVQVFGYNAPIVNADATPTTICEGETIQFSENAGQVGTWDWNGPNGFSSSLQNPTITNATAADAGTYTVSGFDADGCENTSSVEITVTTPPSYNTPNGNGGCAGYTLPAITGSDMTGNESYFSGPNGTGTQYNVGDVIPDGTTIYIYDPTLSPACNNEVQFTVSAASGPTANTPTDPIMICYSYTPPISFDFEHNFDDIINQITGGDASLTVNWYESQDPITGMGQTEITNILSPAFWLSQYPPPFGPFYASVTDGTCESTTVQVFVTAEEFPQANNASADICELQTTFDLTTLSSTINATQNVVFYTDAALTNPITNPSSYTVGPTTLYAAAETAGGCQSDVATITLNLQPAPQIDPITDQTACGSFNLPAITGSNITGTSGFYTSPGGINPISGPITSDMTIYAYVDNGGGCVDEVSFMVTITDAPDITPIGDVTACDSYTLPAIPYNANPSGNGAYYTQPNGQGTQYNPGDVITTTTTLFAFDGMAPSCFDEESFTITITNAPDLQLQPNDPLCLGESIDLSTLVNDANSSGITITFHTNNPPNAGNQLPSSVVTPTASTTYFANADGGPGCSDVLAIPITINPLPTANSASMNLCATSGNMATFDLTQLNNTVNGGTGAAVTWYLNNTPSNEITNPSSFTTTSTTVYAVINDGNCDSAPVAVILTVNPAPTSNPAGPLEECATSGNTATFDLTQLNNTINGGTGATVTWYADNALNNVINNANNFSTGSTTVYAVVSDGGSCTSDSEAIQIIVNPTPTANTAFASACGTPDATFNLNNLNTQVGGIGGSVNWFTDAAATQTITNTSSFTISSTTIVYATYTFDGCTSLPAQVTLDVQAGSSATPTSLSACDLGTGQATFDLTSVENIINNNGGDPVSWFFDSNTSTPINNTTNLLTGSITVYAVVGTGDCTSTPVEVTLTVIDMPTANDLSLSACNNGDDTGTFNLTAAENLVTTSSNAVLWSYTSNEPYTTINNPSAVNANTSTVFAIVDNGTCTAVAQVSLEVSNGAELQLTQTAQISCFGATDASLDLSILNGATATNYVWSPSSLNGLEDPQNIGAGVYSVTVTDNNMCESSATITITQPDALVLICGQNQPVSTTGGNDGSAIINIANGTAPYQIDWSGTATGNQQSATAGDVIINNLAAGDYTVTVTDANDCTSTCQFTINEPGCNIALSSDFVNPSCNGATDASITITTTGATSPLSFAWTPDLGDTDNPMSLGAGDYSVTVTDANSCTATTSITIVEPTALSINCQQEMPVSSIGGTDGQASIGFSGGTAPYAIAWSGPTNDSQDNITNTPFIITNLGAGTYNVVLTDANDCTITCEFTIAQPGCNVTIQSQTTDLLCNGDSSGAITITTTGAQEPIQYQWNPDLGNTATPTDLAAGVYDLTITDSNDCTATTSIEITQPDTLFVNCTVTSQGNNNNAASIDFSGGISPYSITWSGPQSGTQNNLTASPLSLTGLDEGTYSVTLTDANDCTTTCGFTIAGTDCNAAIQAQVGVISCFGDSTGIILVSTIETQEPILYQWSPDLGNTSNPTGLPAGTYELTITDANNCTASTSVELTQPDELTLDCSVTNHVSTVGGNDGQASIAFAGGVAPYSIQWTGPQNGTQTALFDSPLALTDLTAGTYEITLTDANACTTTCSFSINQPGCNTVIESTITNVLCAGDNTGSISVIVAGAQVPITYQWSPDLGDTANPTDLTAGTYDLTITDSNNCTDITTFEVTAPTAITLDCNITNHISAPNATDGAATIEFSGGVPPYDIFWNGTTPGNELGVTNSPLAITNLAAGTYDIVLTDANGCTQDCSFVIQDANCDISITPAITNESCPSAQDGQISITINNGAQPLNIDWSNDDYDGMSMLTDLEVGAYAVTVTDANDCVVVFDTTITTTYQAPTASLFEGGVICPKDCFDFNIAFSGTPPFTANIGLIENDQASSFPITVTGQDTTITICGDDYPNIGNAISLSVIDVTDANCFAFSNASASLFILPSFETTIDSTLCFGESLLVNGQTYDSTNPVGQELLTAENGCDSIVNINLMFLPLIESFVTETLCADESMVINGNTYDINTPAGTEVITNGSSNGCDSTVHIDLAFHPQVDLSISGDATICADENTEILFTTNSTSTLSVTWMFGGTTETINIINGNVFDASPSNTTTYTIIDVSDDTGCPINITNNQITIEVENFTTDAFVVQDISCAGENDGIVGVLPSPGATTDYTYNWNNGHTQSNLANVGEGTYDVTVTSSAGCTQTDQVTLVAPNELVINYTTLAGDCFGNSLGTLQVDNITGGSGIYQYTLEGVTPNFTNIDGLPLIIGNLPVGQLTLIVRDDVGCEETITVNIPEPEELNLDLGPDITIELGEFTTLTGLANFVVDSLVWSPTDSLLMPDQISTAANPTITMTYHLTVFDEQGCSTSDAITVYVKQDSEVFVPSAFSPNGDGINDIMMVFSNQSVREIERFAIYDRWGDKVFEQTNFLPNDPNYGWDGNFQGKPMNPAVFVYYVEYTTIDNRRETLKGDLVLLR